MIIDVLVVCTLQAGSPKSPVAARENPSERPGFTYVFEQGRGCGNNVPGDSPGPRALVLITQIKKEQSIDVSVVVQIKIA